MKNAVKLNAYEVLGIPEGASKITVKNAWIKKLKEIHPDVNKDANAENQARKINVAYAAIKSGQNTFLFSDETKSQDELKIKKQKAINKIENFDCLQKIEKETYINKINQVYTPIEVEVEFGENYDAVISTSALHHFKKEEKVKLYKKILDCLKENGQFINCDKIALTEEIEKHQLYELEHNIENHRHIDTPLTVEHEIEALKRVGFEEITSSNVDKEDYSLIKARKIK